MTIPSTRTYLHEGTVQGAFIVDVPVGFKNLEPDRRRLVQGSIFSDITLTQGDLVQFSAGFITSADNATKPGEVAGVIEHTITGTAGISSQVIYDASIVDGVAFGVLLSDATVTAAYQGIYAVLGETNDRILASAQTVDSALFQIEQILSTTNKVAKVIINRGQNS